MNVDETWLCHYDPDTKQQSMEWRNSSSPRPKKFRVQKSAWEILASIFWDQDGILLIIFQRAKLSTRNITHFCWCDWRTFWRINTGRGKVIKVILFLHDNAPTHRALATQKKVGYLGFQYLDHPPCSPDLAPSDYHLFAELKNNWNVTIFRPTGMSLLPRRPGWTENLLNFLEWLAKVRATG